MGLTFLLLKKKHKACQNTQVHVNGHLHKQSWLLQYIYGTCNEFMVILTEGYRQKEK